MLSEKYIFRGLVLFFLVISSSLLLAQDKNEALVIDVSLIGNSYDTIPAKILYANQYNLQFNISICDTSGNVIELLSPKEIKGFFYRLEDIETVFISRDSPTGVGRVFVRLLYQGRFDVYQYLELNSKSTQYSFRTLYYLWDSEWMEPPITHEFERQSLLYHFAKCPELEYKIKTGAYGFSQIKSILQEYENCPLTDDYEFFYE